MAKRKTSLHARRRPARQGRSCRPRRSRCRRCWRPAAIWRFAKRSTLMFSAFGRLQAFREVVRPSDGAHRTAIHRADRDGLPARQRRRVDPHAVGPHPDGRDPCDDRSRPPDRQGPADQIGQPARWAQRADPAVAGGRSRHPRHQSHCSARSTTCCFRTYRAQDFAVVAKFLRTFALNTEYAMAAVRRADRQRAR